MATLAIHFDEFCPNCGDGVDALHPLTGFCYTCSPILAGIRYECETCGKEFIPYQNSRKTCLNCRNIEWLVRNADAIERVMVFYGINAIQAIIKVHDDNRPHCAMCGDKIKHGTKGRSFFCNKRDECRRAAVRFRNYKIRNNMSESEALEKATHGKGK